MITGKKLKVLSALLVLAYFISIFPLSHFGSQKVSAAEVFNDVPQTHWASQYIYAMAERNILLGKGNNLFGPEEKISKSHALLIASRIIGYNDPVNAAHVQFASNLYAETLSKYTVPNKDEYAYLLYWGVLSPSDLDAYISPATMDLPLLRHEAAVLITNLMGKDAVRTARSISVVSNPYTDQKDIPSSSLPFVNYVSQMGLMMGMGGNTFSPLTTLTRAQLSTIMYRVDAKLNFTIIEGTVNNSVVEGDIQKIDLKTAQKDTQIYQFNAFTSVMKDGVECKTTDFTPGMTVRLYRQGEEVTQQRTRLLCGLTGSGGGTVVSGKDGIFTGFIKSVNVNASNIEIISFQRDGRTAPETFELDSICTINSEYGTPISTTRIVPDSYARVEIVGGMVKSINIEDKQKRLYGYIEDVMPMVTMNSSVTKVTVSYNESGIKKTASYNLAPGAIIIESGAIKGESAVVKDKYAAIVLQNEMIKVISILNEYTVEGNIASITGDVTSGSAAVYITLSQSDGASRRYQANDKLEVLRNDGKTSLSDFVVGESVTADIVSEKIVRLSQSDQLYAAYDSYNIGSPTSAVAITVKLGLSNDKFEIYELAANAVLRKNNNPALIQDFTKGEEVVVKIKDGKISTLSSVTSATDKAIVKAVSIGTIEAPTAITIDIVGADGRQQHLTLSPTCKIDKEGKAMTIKDLSVDDEISYKLIDGKVSSITILKLANKITSGTVETISIGATLTIALRDSAGNRSEFNAEKDIKVYVDNIAGTIYDIRTGYEARVTLVAGETVTEVYVTTPKLGSTITGTVSSIDLPNQTIKLKQDDSDVQIAIIVSPTNTYIINAKTSQSLLLRDVKVGATLMVLGSGNINAYHATNITVAQ